MAAALKDQYGIEVAERIADQIQAVYPAFDTQNFLRDCGDGYESLELMPRGQRIAGLLAVYLPDSFPDAIRILLRTIGPVLERTENNGMAPFFYMPHTLFVADRGLDDFELAMQAQYELTQRFTAEFSIRAFIERDQTRTLERLERWTSDRSVHVRRLVSEGTRPRLPWARRLKSFQADPTPALALLERLKDDPELYVRRSVANHLNDIGKDHPDLLCEIAARWSEAGNPGRTWLVKHALRSLIKQGYAPAFEVLGYSSETSIVVRDLRAKPETVRVGEAVNIVATVNNQSRQKAAAIVDVQLFFVKANGELRPKTFKLKMLELAAGESVTVSKSVSFRPMTTRVHYPGEHRAKLLINGKPQGETAFWLKQ